MKILVTGGAGFIGSNIVDAYINKGLKVAIIDNLSTGKKININSKAKFYHADIRDKKKVLNICLTVKPDIINHHAAQIDVRKSVTDPQFDAHVNVIGSINLLEAAKLSKVKKVIFASSGGTIYGECSKKAPDETFPARPLSPYGVTKRAFELYLTYYAHLFNIKYTILRYANVFGPRQDPHGEAGVVAIFANRLLSNDDVFIFGNGEQKRDYVFVKDVVKANILALTKGNNEIINIGTEKPTSVNALFLAMSKITSSKNKPIYKPHRPGELQKSFLKIKKARKTLGWKPSVSFNDGLKATIDYFMKRLPK